MELKDIQKAHAAEVARVGQGSDQPSGRDRHGKRGADQGHRRRQGHHLRRVIQGYPRDPRYQTGHSRAQKTESGVAGGERRPEKTQTDTEKDQAGKAADPASGP